MSCAILPFCPQVLDVTLFSWNHEQLEAVSSLPVITVQIDYSFARLKGQRFRTDGLGKIWFGISERLNFVASVFAFIKPCSHIKCEQ